MCSARRAHLFFVGCLWAFLLFVPGRPGHAASWQATLHDIALPVRVVAVDKSLQELHLFERQSPVRLVRSFPCTTGQQPGDKQATGDLRTPEGVYFIGYKIAAGLDFKEYGGIAYTLNYPNPVDRLNGKTGHGIWIHSKGRDIVPLETRGCVAVNLPHIADLGPRLTPGTAVVMAESVSGAVSSAQSPITARLLKNKMQQWSKAWASRSPSMFTFYAPEAYSKTQPESFQAFRANKERLFKMLPWIEIINRDIHVLEGPNYWVTWTEQYYHAPNLSAEGVRRLYWQRDSKGEFRIVGMEWEPRDLGMRADILKGAFANAPDGVSSDAALLPPDADEARPVGVSEATQTRPILPEEITAPQRAVLLPPDAITTTAALSDPNAQPLPLPLVSAQTPLESELRPSRMTPTAPPDNETILLLQHRTSEWLNKLSERSPEFFTFYDQNTYGARLGTRQSFRSLKAEQERVFRHAWLHVQHRPVRVEKQGDHWVSSFSLLLRAPAFSEEGVRRLYWQQGQDGQFRIVGSDWNAQNLAIQADYLENITPQISAVIEAWRQTWEKGALEAYEKFYAPGARQGGRSGSAVFRYKEQVWAKAGPERVEFSGMRIQMDKNGIRVDMAQNYRDNSGYQDKGVKTLLLHPQGDSWRIAAEDWAPAP